MGRTEVTKFVDDDEGYLGWVAAHPDGFVLNANRRPRADYLCLHRSSCRSISGRPAKGSRWTADYIKVCGNRDQLNEWATAAAGGEVWECGLCLPAC